MPQLPTDLQEALGAYIRTVAREEIEKSQVKTHPGEYLSTSEGAELARVTQGTIRRWIREGLLHAHRAGRELRVKRHELEELMKPGKRRQRSNDHLLTPEALAARDFD